ncbi:DinB family protein [Spirosoma sp.]|uniref:DinB family protein n=1 Tax=Spirosoma sp. TaxID=1899569 RepID=UPI003B3AF6B1
MDALNRLRNHIADVPSRVVLRSAAELTKKMRGKWSRKEILGHLIDSAVNNLKRFTDAQFADGPYPIQPYRQDELVRVNHYQELPLAHLLTLWQSLNTQILYVAEATPAEALAQPVHINTSDVKEYTLGWLIEDYVAHLEHHLKTLL